MGVAAELAAVGDVVREVVGEVEAITGGEDKKGEEALVEMVLEGAGAADSSST